MTLPSDRLVTKTSSKAILKSVEQGYSCKANPSVVALAIHVAGNHHPGIFDFQARNHGCHRCPECAALTQFIQH